MIALSLLIALMLYVWLAWVVVRMVGWLARIRVFTTVTTKVLQALCVALFVLLPTWDIIPGRLYFQYLCDTEAGVKVFRTVEVDQSYFRPDRRPDDKKLAKRYVQTSKFDRNFSTRFHIAKTEGVLQDKESGEKLGTATDFFYHGGWLTVFLLPEGAGTSCQIDPNFGVHTAIWGEVIKPKPGFGEGKN